MARLENGRDSTAPFSRNVFPPNVYALRASSEFVVACASGTSNFRTEYRVARCVREIGEHDGVFLRQRRCVARTKVETTSDQGGDHNDSSGNQNLPELLARYRRFGNFHCAR